MFQENIVNWKPFVCVSYGREHLRQLDRFRNSCEKHSKLYSQHLSGVVRHIRSRVLFFFYITEKKREPLPAISWYRVESAFC